jgi:hypothetical protein
MADIVYYGTDEEAISLARFLIENFDASIHVDDSPTPEPRLIREAQDVVQLFSSQFVPLLHVTSPLWSVLPLTTKEVHTNDGRHFFSVDQRHGGPSFLWSVPRPMQNDGKLILKLGSFGDWPSYYLSKSSTATIPRPPKMAQVYQEVSRRIRGGALRSRWKKSGNAGPWVCPGAQAKLTEGYQLASGEPLIVSPRPLTAASTRTRARAARAGNAGR